MNYDFVIVHGSFGDPFENWIPWLYRKLTAKGKKVLVPQFPALNQNYGSWFKALKAYEDFINEGTSFVAHSLGPAFVVDYLINTQTKVGNLYFAAPFYGLIDIAEFDKVNHTFFMHEDFTEAKSFFDKAVCFYSDNDPYVPNGMSIDFCEALNASASIVSGGGHLNENAGFLTFPQMLEAITEYE